VLKDDDLTVRIQRLVDSEVGHPVFYAQSELSLAPYPKPKLSRLVLEALVGSTPLPDGQPVALILYSGGMEGKEARHATPRGFSEAIAQMYARV
jgi:hypothetical protein